MKDPAKGAKKLLKAQKRQERVTKSAADFLKSYATERTLRLNALETLVKTAIRQQEQETGLASTAAVADPGAAYMHAREMLKAGREDDAMRARGLPPVSQASAIQTASAPAVANALGAAINRGPHDPRGALVGMFRGDYVRHSPESLPGGDPTMPSLRQNHEADTEIRALEKQLKRGQLTKEEREITGFRLTRARLIQGHRQGVI